MEHNKAARRSLGGGFGALAILVPDGPECWGWGGETIPEPNEDEEDDGRLQPSAEVKPGDSTAFAEERRRSQVVLFPVRIDETVMKTTEPWAVKLRDQRNIGDFQQWKDHDTYQQAFDRVLRDLKAAPG